MQREPPQPGLGVPEYGLPDLQVGYPGVASKEIDAEVELPLAYGARHQVEDGDRVG